MKGRYGSMPEKVKRVAFRELGPGKNEIGGGNL